MIDWFIKAFPEHTDLWLIICGCYSLMIVAIALFLIGDKK